MKKKEIERKFLVEEPFSPEAEGYRWLGDDEIVQGYLNDEAGTPFRIRIINDVFATRTVKGPDVNGVRDEDEKELPLEEARELLASLDRPALLKTRSRYLAPDGNPPYVWEVDRFRGVVNGGLILAEVELPARDAAVVIPHWAGREVTGDPEYHNYTLAQAEVHVP